jgi:5'-deoxynucleotidase YfbR-like HD superfamily hydrolase
MKNFSPGANAASGKRAPYFTTVSGREIDLVNPSPADVSFEDIAHHLAHNCRFGGAVRETYTVAQHCVLGARLCSQVAKPYFIAHDAHEAFAGDDTTPKKRAFPLVIHEMLGGRAEADQLVMFKMMVRNAFDEFEKRHMKAVHEAAGLAWPVPRDIEREVKFVDRVMLLTEWRALMPGDVPEAYRTLDGEAIEPRDMTIIPWRFDQAKSEFFGACVSYLPCFAKPKRDQVRGH